jgi:hypothetical protein
VSTRIILAVRKGVSAHVFTYRGDDPDDREQADKDAARFKREGWKVTLLVEDRSLPLNLVRTTEPRRAHRRGFSLPGSRRPIEGCSVPHIPAPVPSLAGNGHPGIMGTDPVKPPLLPLRRRPIERDRNGVGGGRRATLLDRRHGSYCRILILWAAPSGQGWSGLPFVLVRGLFGRPVPPAPLG